VPELPDELELLDELELVPDEEPPLVGASSSPLHAMTTAAPPRIAANVTTKLF